MKMEEAGTGFDGNTYALRTSLTKSIIVTNLDFMKLVAGIPFLGSIM